MSPLMSAGFELMLVGMGTVFFFLTLLVFATRLMSNMTQRWQPAPVASDQGEGVHADISAEEVAAITAAVARYRNHRGK